MKKFVCFISGTVLILFSCGTDGDAYDHQAGMPDSLHRGPSPVPGNNDNVYDHIGRSYRETLNQYSKSYSTTVAESFGQGIRKFNSGRTGQLQKWNILSSGQSGKNDTVAIDSLQALETIITDSDLTFEARTGLLNFIGNVLVLQYDGYDVLYDHIVGYEVVVTGHPAFTARDKQVILIFSSLVRHATYPGTTPMTEDEDEDWDLSMGNIMRLVLMSLEDTEEGSLSSMPFYAGHETPK